MFGNFASLHAYVATVAFANASSESSETLSAHLLSDDAAPVPAPSAIVDKGKLITSAASRSADRGALTDNRTASILRRAA